MSVSVLADVRREAWRLTPDRLAEKLSYDPDTGESEWRRAPHLAYIARRVTQAIARGNGRIIVEMPPRHGKSELLSHWLPVWLLALRPKSRIMLASYEATFAAEWGRAVRNTIQEHSDLLGVKVASDSSAADRWRTTAGGGMWTAGAGGPFTGRGGELLLIDDPHKNFAEAHSPTVREGIWNWYTSTARSRLHPGGTIIVVQTRWHEDDLAGRLIKASEDGTGEKWEVIRLPAIAEEDEHPRPDGIGRLEGEALWGDWYDLDALASIKAAVGSYVWNGLYQQRPSAPEGTLLRRGWWNWYDRLPDPMSIDEWLISWDMAFKDAESSSFVVGQVWARVGSRKFLIEQVRDRMDFPTTRRAVKLLAETYPQARRIIVEDKANGPAIIADLENEVSGLVPWSPPGSKESRVHAVSGDIESGQVYLPDSSLKAWVGDFVEEAATFPNGTNDDQVDAMTQALLQWSNADGVNITEYQPGAHLAGRR